MMELKEPWMKDVKHIGYHFVINDKMDLIAQFKPSDFIKDKKSKLHFFISGSMSNGKRDKQVAGNI